MVGNDKIRVLMMLDAFDIGGTETYVLSITQALLDRNVSVFVSGSPGPLEKKFRRLSCKVTTAVNRKSRFEAWIVKNRINLIHAHFQTSGKYAIDLSKKYRIPLIFTFHGTYYDGSLFQKLLASSAQPKTVSVSAPVQAWLAKKGIASTVIPNGIDMHEYYAMPTDLRATLGIPESSRVVLYASRLEDRKYKICKRLLIAFKKELLQKFPDVYLLVAGGGEKTGHIVKRIKTISSERIRYIGNRTDMAELYSMSDYVVGTGRVALEAIACERPVIAIGSKGTLGLVQPSNFRKALRSHFCDHKGHLPLSQTHISKAVRSALQSIFPTRRGLRAMRKQVQNLFEVSRVTNHLLEIYKESILEGGVARGLR